MNPTVRQRVAPLAPSLGYNSLAQLGAQLLGLSRSGGKPRSIGGDPRREASERDPAQRGPAEQEVQFIPIVDSNAPVCRNQTGVSTAFLWFMNVKTPRVNQLSPSKPKTRSTFSQKGLSTSVISDSIEVNVSKTLFPI